MTAYEIWPLMTAYEIMVSEGVFGCSSDSEIVFGKTIPSRSSLPAALG